MTTNPDTGVALSIRMPLVLDPSERVHNGIAVRGYAIDTGELLVSTELLGDSHTTLQMATANLPRMVPALLMCGYDGDNGQLMMTSIVRTSDHTASLGEHGIPDEIWDALNQAKGDDAEPCPICNPHVVAGDPVDLEVCHRECVLFNYLGPQFVNISDAPARVQALELWARVERDGLVAAVAHWSDDKPDDSVSGNGEKAAASTS